MKHLYSNIEIPSIFLMILGLVSFCATAQHNIPTSSSAASFFMEGNMSEANSQYGALLSIEPDQLDFQYYYAVTCTADSSLRQEGIQRLIVLEGKMESEAERLFFLALAYQHIEDFTQATNFFHRAIAYSDKKSEWLNEAEFRLVQCEALQDLAPPTISIAYSSKDEVGLGDFFRSIPTESTPFRITLVPTGLRTTLDKKRGWVSPVVYNPESDVIYFCSYGNKGSTGLDIYMANISPDGSLSESQRLPDSVNSAADDINPVYHKETESIIFASDRASSLGGFDLFSAKVISPSGKYESPERLPRAWNTSSNEYFLFPDSNTLADGNLSGGWLVSDRSGHFSSAVLYRSHAESNAKLEPLEQEQQEDSVEVSSIAIHSTLPAPEIKENMEPENVIVVQEEPVLELVIERVQTSGLAIQVGVFSSLPDVGFLPKNTEIIVKTLPNGLIKVFVGPFVNEEERRNAKVELIAYGLVDVFNATVIQTEKSEKEIQTTPLVTLEGIHSTDQLTGIWYAVQIGVFSGEPSQPMLTMTQGNLFYEVLSDGLKRWYTEASRSVDQTLEMLPILIQRGARTDAFIVQLEDGKRMKIIAMNTVARESGVVQPTETEVADAPVAFYRVRIASFVNSIPAIEAAALLHLGTLVTVRSIEIAGEKVYFTSKLPLDEAERAYDLAVQEGFNNARIEKFND
jgi:tetratricopeptide (TPR) repeat protein